MDDAALIRDLEHSMGAFPLSLGGRCAHCDRIQREAAERYFRENSERMFAELMKRIEAQDDGAA